MATIHTAADWQTEWFQIADGVENISLDLREKHNCVSATRDAEQVYQLAADMGGMGFIENNKAICMLNVLTSTNMNTRTLGE